MNYLNCLKKKTEWLFHRLNWFKMLAVDGRIDSTDYQAFEKIYTNQMEVRQMFATAISEKDKRLIQEGEAKGKAEGLAEGELRAMKKMAKQMKADGLSHEAISKYTGLSKCRNSKALKWLCQPGFFPSRLPTMPFNLYPKGI